jgi:hypothetical protein
MMNDDTIKISILPDGTIKIETDKISGPNHLSAEKFVKAVQELAGGTTQATRKVGAMHQHDHVHDTSTHSH